MKSLWNSIAAAFSTFSVLPAPRVDWDKYNLRWMLCALPLVGLITGGFICLYYLLAETAHLPVLLSAAALTVLPVIISGGIHLDGFCDTIDALSSHASPDKKREILKDPHAGAFAIIGACCFFVLHIGLCSVITLTWKYVILFSLTHVLSRILGAFLSVTVPTAHEGMLKTFTDRASRASVVILIIWGVVSLAACAYFSLIACAVLAFTAVCTYFAVRYTAKKEFGGMSGDIAGYSITLSELLFLIMLVIAERIETLWFL